MDMTPVTISRRHDVADFAARLAMSLYNLLWGVGVVGWISLRIVMQRRWGWSGVAERLGYFPVRPGAATSVHWIHAVSVGELYSVAPVIRRLKSRDPGAWVLVTTSHPLAYRLAKGGVGGADAVALSPWDWGPTVRVALARVRPNTLSLVECELWPNLIHEAAKAGTRIAMINARLYPRDFPRYRMASWLFAPLLEKMDLIGAASAKERERFLELGAPTERVAITGNTKLDVELPGDFLGRSEAMRRILPIGPGPIIALASTHPGEEARLLAAASALWGHYPCAQIIIAPRHPARGEEIAELAKSLGRTSARRSKLTDSSSRRRRFDAPAVIVLDTVGELLPVIGLADVVFVGGSLVPRGGQNPIEPALCGKPIIIGPDYSHFGPIVDALAEKDAVRVVATAEDAIDVARGLLANPVAAAEEGRRAAAVVAACRGAADATVDRLRAMVAPSASARAA